MISLIAAVAENGVIGRAGALPWRLPADLKRFRALTLGHPVVMGRRTHKSLGRPLPGRTNIVVTRAVEYDAPGCRVAHSIEDALAIAGDDPEIFIIGGADLYAQTLTRVQRMHLTRVHATVSGDTRFPEFDTSAWREIARERHEADALHAHAFSFITLERS